MGKEKRRRINGDKKENRLGSEEKCGNMCEWEGMDKREEKFREAEMKFVDHRMIWIM